MLIIGDTEYVNMFGLMIRFFLRENKILTKKKTSKPRIRVSSTEQKQVFVSIHLNYQKQYRNYSKIIIIFFHFHPTLTVARVLQANVEKMTENGNDSIIGRYEEA